MPTHRSRTSSGEQSAVEAPDTRASHADTGAGAGVGAGAGARSGARLGARTRPKPSSRLLVHVSDGSTSRVRDSCSDMGADDGDDTRSWRDEAKASPAPRGITVDVDATAEPAVATARAGLDLHVLSPVRWTALLRVCATPLIAW